MKLSKIFFCIFCLYGSMPGVLSTHAQSPRHEVYASWEDFVNEGFIPYAALDENGNLTTEAQEDLLDLHDLSMHPMNLNAASRQQLLQLPFLTEAQVDSVLNYRTRKGQFLTLGELQFISGIDYQTRRFLSVFAVCEPLSPPPASQRERWFKGRYELSYTTDFPLQQRAGFEPFKANGTMKPRSEIYLGEPLHHLVRLRYAHREGISYGITLEQDSGEPFRKGRIQPFDHASGYVRLASPTSHWDICLGDYRLHIAQGLLIGKATFSGRMALLNAKASITSLWRPHTGTDETNYFRGFAATYSRNQWKTSAFVSYRDLDANIDLGVATSIQSTGLHRTPLELEKRGTLRTISGGVNITRILDKHTLQFNAYALSFSPTLQPAANPEYAFHGTSAGGLSTAYSLRQRKWQGQCELAINHDRQIAATGWMHHSPTADLRLTLHARYFSSHYTAPLAQTLSASQNAQGEQAILIGITHRNIRQWQCEGYAELYQRTIPTVSIPKGAKGLSAVVQGRRALSKKSSLRLRYQYSARQQRIAGYNNASQWMGRHRWRIQTSWDAPTISLNGQIEAILNTSQTASPSWGALIALRASMKCNNNLKLSGMAAYFHASDSDTRLYAYEPQFRGTYNFGQYSNRGFRAVGLLAWQVAGHGELGLRLAWMHLLNRNTIGTGAQQIDGASLTTVGVQLRLF